LEGSEPVFPPSIQDLSEVLAAISIILLTASFVISASEERYEILVSHKKLEGVGIAIGVVYIVYFVLQFGLAVVIK
jgi:hypothetical protein